VNIAAGEKIDSIGGYTDMGAYRTESLELKVFSKGPPVVRATK
jgi:hypothetical protein